MVNLHLLKAYWKYGEYLLKDYLNNLFPLLIFSYFTKISKSGPKTDILAWLPWEKSSKGKPSSIFPLLSISTCAKFHAFDRMCTIAMSIVFTNAKILACWNWNLCNRFTTSKTAPFNDFGKAETCLLHIKLK